MPTVFWLEIPKERGHSDDLGVNGKIILEWILGTQNGKVWTECIWLRMGQMAGCNEPLGSIRGENFLNSCDLVSQGGHYILDIPTMKCNILFG